jgi:septal ring factor EnvC (AmiA/AmiB activator)
MPRPLNERQALERERDELPAQLAAYQKELEATPATFKERRERLEWQIRLAQRRMAEVEAREVTWRLGSEHARTLIVEASSCPVFDAAGLR